MTVRNSKGKRAVRKKKKNKAPVSSTGSRRGQGSARFSFRLLLVIALLATVTCFFRVFMCQVTAKRCLEESRINDMISVEKAEQKNLRQELVGLKSPERIADISGVELGMADPVGVIYLRYSIDENGNLSSESSAISRAGTIYQPETGSSPLEEEDGSLTRR